MSYSVEDVVLLDFALQWTTLRLEIYLLCIQHSFFCSGKKYDVSGTWHLKSKCLFSFEKEGIALVLDGNVLPTPNH